MEKMFSLGRATLLCNLLLWCFQGCWCTVTVFVTPVVESLKGESIKLPCDFNVPKTSSVSTLEWFIEESGNRKRVAFKPLSGGEGKIDEGTRLFGRATIGDDFSLSVSPVHVEDTRRFHCQVTAGPSGVGEGVTELRVFFAPEKPEISVSSEVISVTDSSTSEMGQCISRNGYPVPRIIWYKDSIPLPEVTDSRTDMYMVPSVVKEASGLLTVSSTLYLQPKKEDRLSKFYCKVEYNMTGGQILSKASESFGLTLHYPAEHVTFSLMSSEPIKEGDNVELKCETDGNPQPEFDFMFIKDGTEMQKTGSAGILTLSSVTRDDAGTYRCEALDFDAVEIDLVRELTLSIHYLNPVMITPPGPVLAVLGADVELRCKTDGSDKHTIQWRRGAEVLSQTEVLSLKSVSFSHAGNYSCVGAVPTVPGLHKQANLTLTVTGKPEIEEPSGPAEVQKEGDQVTLTCSAQGHPAPQFTWTPSGKEAVEVKGNKLISTLTLDATAAILENGVTCEVNNVHGKDTKLFAVVIKKDGRSDTTDSNDADRAERQQGGSSGVVIAVVVCVLLLLLLVAVLYFLQKNRKLPCGKQDKDDIEGGKGSKAKSEEKDEQSDQKEPLKSTEQ